MARFQAFAVVAALLGGCAGSPLARAVDVKVGEGEVVMGVMADVAHGRLLQSIVSAYTPADVDHLTVDLYKQQADSSFALVATQDTPAGSGVTKTVNFAHLKMNTTYKVAVKCYHAGGADITKAGTGTSTVTTSSDDFVPVAVAVTLADKTFDGSMHPVITVSSGSVVNTGSAESGAVADNQ